MEFVLTICAVGIAGFLSGYLYGMWAVEKRSNDAPSVPPVGRWRRSTRLARQSVILPPIDYSVIERVNNDDYIAEQEAMEHELELSKRRGAPYAE